MGLSEVVTQDSSRKLCSELSRAVWNTMGVRKFTTMVLAMH